MQEIERLYIQKIYGAWVQHNQVLRDISMDRNKANQKLLRNRPISTVLRRELIAKQQNLDTWQLFINTATQYGVLDDRD